MTTSAPADARDLALAVARAAAALLRQGWGRAGAVRNNLREFGHMQVRAGAVRRLGSASLDLCFVARGWLDGYWEELRPQASDLGLRIRNPRPEALAPGLRPGQRPWRWPRARSWPRTAASTRR